MKIVVLNGSPKGDLSATMQYILYVQKKIPYYTFKIINISQQIKKIETNQVFFQKIIDEIECSDGVIWATPVYVLLVPYQYKRFIELISERKEKNAFKDKYTVSLTTSINFFDHTAHNYLRAISEDLEMKFFGSYSAMMMDLLNEKERVRLVSFMENFFYAIENKFPTSKHFTPISLSEFEYIPGEMVNEKKKIEGENKKILVLTDSTDESTNLGKMIKRFRMSFSVPINVVDINTVDIKGGCLGCCQCGYDNQCVYGEKDGFMEFWNSTLSIYDIIVFGGNIVDRYLSSRWKMVFDRAFFKNHVPTLIDKQVGVIISGPFNQIPNLKQILASYLTSQGANCVDFISDEYENSDEIDSLLYNFANKLIMYSNSKFIQPRMFFNVGGELLFRDWIYRTMRLVFRADDKYYEKHGIYDTFPQNDIQAKKLNDALIPKIENDENFRKQFYTMVKSMMIKPLQAIVKNPNS